MTTAAMLSPRPLSERSFERANPTPPKIQPKSGMKNEQIKAAIAIPLLLGAGAMCAHCLHTGHIKVSAEIMLLQDLHTF